MPRCIYLMKSIDLQTPAKINLYLGVLGRRPDGYHYIETLFQTIDLFDDVFMKKTMNGLAIQAPGHPELETSENLAVGAHTWLEKRIGRRLPVTISIRKRIPIAAGLGGGSSDAAAVLIGLRALYDLDLSEDELAEGAVAVGADAPFFLKGGAAVGEGIGERLTPVEFPRDYSVVLVNPGFPVSTALVYQLYSRGLTGRFAEGRLWQLLANRAGLEDLLYNDLQPVCETLHPEIAHMRRSLASVGIRESLMSGSGPTVFGVIRDTHTLPQAEYLSSVLGKHTWTVLRARPIPFGVQVC